MSLKYTERSQMIILLTVAGLLVYFAITKKEIEPNLLMLLSTAMSIPTPNTENEKENKNEDLS